MRKTIYVSSEEVWNDVRQKSAGLGLSISEYLLGAKHTPTSQLNRIEAKLDLLLGDRPPGEKISRGDMVVLKAGEDLDAHDLVRAVRSDDEVLKEAQAKLEKIQRVHFNPQPKRGSK